MTASLVVLLLVLAGIPVNCKKQLAIGILLAIPCCLDSECGDNNSTTVLMDIRSDGEEYIANFTCSTKLQASFPRWEINGKNYVTNLPHHVSAEAMSIEMKLTVSVMVRCFVKTFNGSSVVDVYSNNTGTIMQASNQG